MKTLSINAQTAYFDLVRLLKDEAVSDFRGGLTMRKVGDKGYWYDRYRLGDDIVERYIGVDSPELRERIARTEAIQEESAERYEQTARLVRTLVAEGAMSVPVESGRIIKAFSDAGVFRLGGTHIMTRFQGELSGKTVWLPHLR